MTPWDVAANIIANILTAFLAVTAGYLIFFVSEWRGLLRFFGIRKGMVDLRIYLSRVEITSPRSTRKFAHYAMDDNRGPLIGLTELEAALLVQRKLRSRIALAYFPQAIIEWLRRRISFLAVEPQIEICPRAATDIAEDNLVVLGSGTYNPVAQYFFETQKLFFEFDVDDRGHLKARRNDKKLEISGRTDGKDLCLLQRVTLREEDGALERRVFICSGTGQAATYASVQFLIESWRTLQKEFGDNDFGILLSIPFVDRDSEDVPMHKAIPIEKVTTSTPRPPRALAMRPQSWEFFEMNHEQLVEQVAEVGPLIKAIVNARALGVYDEHCLIEVLVPGQQAMFFDISECEFVTPAPSESAYLRLHFETFRALIFPDLARYTSAEEAFVEVGARERGADHMGDMRLFLVCATWYGAYAEAARLFFEDTVRISSYFRRFATMWWNPPKLQAGEHLRYLHQIYEQFSAKGKIVLEAGCGFGRVSSSLSMRARRWIALDVSTDMIVQARHRLTDRRNLALIVANVTSLPIRGAVDMVLALQVMVHLSDPFGVAASLWASVKQGGEMYVDFTCTRARIRQYRQESFFTRVYNEEFVRRRLAQLGFPEPTRVMTGEDRHQHYWLCFCFVKPVTE